MKHNPWLIHPNLNSRVGPTQLTRKVLSIKRKTWKYVSTGEVKKLTGDGMRIQRGRLINILR